MSAKQISSEKVETSQSSAYHPSFSESDKKKYGKYICYIGEFILRDIVHRAKIVTTRGQVEYFPINHTNPKKKKLYFHVQFTDGTGDDLELKEIEGKSFLIIHCSIFRKDSVQELTETQLLKEGIREYKRKGELASSEKQVLLAVDKEMLLTGNNDDRDMFLAMQSAVKLTIGNKRVELRPNKENQIAPKVGKLGVSDSAALKDDQSASKPKITEVGTTTVSGDIVMSDFEYSDLSYQESSQSAADDSMVYDDDDVSEYEASDGVDESFT
ncbi:predicted protein [Chaetoceros tenuissimus]|uniref:Uncharacterized protein n=1 Tax=Chaetoceros tenuissimus TaxID=426638 RepID=A0AAD3DB29_9STRA|nr:predicted protein [Chaetoceros tenuissimus]